MKPSLRRILIIAVSITALFASWAAASIYSAKRTEARLQELVKLSATDSSYKLKNLEHKTGLFSSSGQLDLSLIDECDLSGQMPELFAVHVSYQISHWILPGSLLRMHWSVEPQGQTRADFERLFSGQAKLSGTGKMDFFGALHSDMTLPELKLVNQDNVLTISPSSGTIAVGRDTLVFDWKTEKLVQRGAGKAMELADLGMQIDIANRHRGIGSAALTVGKLSTSMGSAEGFKLISEVSEHGDRLDMALTPSLKSANFNGKLVTDLILQFAFKGMHAQSVETLIDLSGKSCGFRNLTKEEQLLMRSAIRNLLTAGFSAGIPKLSGAVDGGSLEGSLIVALMKSAGPDIKLASALKSSGELALIGKAITAEEKKTVVAYGIATETPLGVKASFDYANGLLKVNGRIFDATLAEKSLTEIDKSINDFLSGRVKPVEPPVVTPEVTPVDASDGDAGSVDDKKNI
jgi:uncharacterized protein YdgA (DUF945 family)